ncbi:hypothetical protein J6590_048560 [Homalodisca vitripennis]|nr:hypothetical protein J6590_048560 [Homalodisca vitripennis]
MAALGRPHPDHRYIPSSHPVLMDRGRRRHKGCRNCVRPSVCLDWHFKTTAAAVSQQCGGGAEFLDGVTFLILSTGHSPVWWGGGLGSLPGRSRSPPVNKQIMRHELYNRFLPVPGSRHATRHRLYRDSRRPSPWTPVRLNTCSLADVYQETHRNVNYFDSFFITQKMIS